MVGKPTSADIEMLARIIHDSAVAHRWFGPDYKVLYDVLKYDHPERWNKFNAQVLEMISNGKVLLAQDPPGPDSQPGSIVDKKA